MIFLIQFYVDSNQMFRKIKGVVMEYLVKLLDMFIISPKSTLLINTAFVLWESYRKIILELLRHISPQLLW